MDVVELCKKYHHEGVVAIDLAGDESLNCEAYPGHRKAYEVSMLKHQHNTNRQFKSGMGKTKKRCVFVLYTLITASCTPTYSFKPVLQRQ